MLYHHSHHVRDIPKGCLLFNNAVRDLKPGEQNGPVERFARPGSESSPNAQHGVQAKDDLSGESLNRTKRKHPGRGAFLFGYVMRGLNFQRNNRRFCFARFG